MKFKIKEQLAIANCSNQGCNSRCIYIIDGILSFMQGVERNEIS